MVDNLTRIFVKNSNKFLISKNKKYCKRYYIYKVVIMMKFEDSKIQEFWDSFYIANALSDKIKFRCCCTSQDANEEFFEYMINEYLIIAHTIRSKVNNVSIYRNQIKIFDGNPDEKIFDILKVV